ncbi:hypothetical protein PQG02_27200 [Nostoc sp. UHCC 0926]|nr:hypothetical protein PQG02_27200 [Nostoc sp. UHCC 0926]
MKSSDPIAQPQYQRLRQQVRDRQKPLYGTRVRLRFDAKFIYGDCNA